MTTPPPADSPPNHTYAAAGVDIDAGERAVELFKGRVRKTDRPEVLGGIGGFAGLFALGRSGYQQPILVSATDGVGTKIMLAQQMGVHDTVGIDLVAMSANDVAVQGAEPLFFLDYIVTGKVVPETIEQIVSGVAEGCLRAGCALLGGEIAEHPGHMSPGDYDLSGFCVGAVEERKVLTGASTIPGDVLVGFASSGVHSNGFSLVRSVLKDGLLGLDENPPELGCTVGEALLEPTVIYWKAVAALQAGGLARGFAHITGGGLAHNLGRIVPPGMQGVIERRTWKIPAIFELIADAGISEREMFRTFNMGVGMVGIVEKSGVAEALRAARKAGYAAWQIGIVRSRPNDEPAVVLR